MKLYPLHIGETKVPYGQFYADGPFNRGIGEEWVDWRGIWRVLTDKSHYIIVPIYAYLIEHDEVGLILVDAGINWDMAHAHHQYYDHWLFRLTLDEDEYRLTRDQELSAHLQRLGYRPEDIEMVVITHLHEDHLGALRDVPQARVVLSEDAWNAKNLGIFLYREWSPSFAEIVKTPDLITYSSGAFHSFEKSQDLLDDGSIVLLPTPGHADGQSSVLVQMEGYQLLLVSDALYTLRHLAVDQLRAIMLGKKMKEEQLDSIRRIQQLRDALPEMIIVPSHDHTAYQFQLLDPFLADGALSPEERQAIHEYEAHLFDTRWQLGPDALPQFLPNANRGSTEDKGDVGAVSEPQIVNNLRAAPAVANVHRP